MFKHILVPTDGSRLSDKAVREAIRLASTLDGRITGVFVTPQFRTLMYEGYVVPSPPAVEQGYRRSAQERAAKVLGAIEKKAAAAGVKCTSVHVVSDIPYDAIIKAARKGKCDLIVMASHGRRGLQGLLLGSETTKVLTHSKIPVLVCR